MDTFLLILQSIVQGIVQGITEWLPISSTGHLKLLDAIWPMAMSESFGEFFEVFIQLGSILAVVVLYFHKLNPLSPKKSKEQKTDTWVLWGKVLVASIPAAVLGLLIDDPMNDWFANYPLAEVAVIATTLLVYGVAFLIIESRKYTPRIESDGALGFKTAFFIGMFQMLALIPGTSRSGSTILGATLLGTSRAVAAEFSFFMALPAMLGASGLKLVKILYEMVFEGLVITGTEWAALATATVVAFVVSLLAIRFLMSFIQKHDFKPFGWYRIALALVLFLCLFVAPNVFV
ncbi:MAG: undecaprenyl-diphosphate phosphatase [Clostridia bacterium]|nr:undecaprenyl-diphosphate phosphatase [Clostridia bacterium]